MKIISFDTIQFLEESHFYGHLKVRKSFNCERSEWLNILIKCKSTTDSIKHGLENGEGEYQLSTKIHQEDSCEWATQCYLLLMQNRCEI